MTYTDYCENTLRETERRPGRSFQEKTERLTYSTVLSSKMKWATWLSNQIALIFRYSMEYFRCCQTPF